MMIDLPLARRLVDTQFPQWKDLPIQPIATSGWDNRTFRLGKNMLVRMPSAPEYAAQVEKEQKWLPILAPLLPLPIPTPLAMGKPAEGYPWCFSIYRYLEGESAASAFISDLSEVAKKLAEFLIALQRIDPSDGPLPGPHSFYRGGALATYDEECAQALLALKDEIDVNAATKIWEEALSSTWQSPPVWVHGDISLGNILIQNGHLSAIIDFGQLTIGDPACDLMIAWTFFKGKSREVFREMLPFDAGTWARARGWILWKSMISMTNMKNPNNAESTQCRRIFKEVLHD